MAGYPVYETYRAAARATQLTPEVLLRGGNRVVTGAMARGNGPRRVQVERNLRRIYGPTYGGAAMARSVRRTFEFYGRYWIESFRLPTLSKREVEARFDYTGFEWIRRSVDNGFGPIIVLPHLGGWEWAAFWTTRVAGLELTAVVEPVEPPELFDWFASYRESLGMHIVPLGPDAGPKILDAIKNQHVICLLTDRYIDGGGVDVDFFGETTTLPAGPATLSLRTGTPLLPSAIYFREPYGCHAVIGEPVAYERKGRLRSDVTALTQILADELEGLIRRAPEQWHLMQPNWPSDFEALGVERGTGPVGL